MSFKIINKKISNSPSISNKLSNKLEIQNNSCETIILKLDQMENEKYNLELYEENIIYDEIEKRWKISYNIIN